MKSAAEKAEAIRKRAAKRDAFATFCTARLNGQSISAACRACGISRDSGTRWERRRLEDQVAQKWVDVENGVVATKNETAKILSDTLRACEPQYKAQVATALSKVMGYEAPQRSQVEVVQAHASTLAWLERIDTIETSEPKAIDVESTPAKALGE